MRSPRPGLLSWIVLGVYLASTVVASRSVVLCREVDGSTVIEIAGEHGQCLGPGGSGSQDAGHAACLDACDSCPCEDSSLVEEPARVVKKDPSPCEVFALESGVAPWSAGHPRLHKRSTCRPDDRAAAVSDAARRLLRSVVLLL